LVYIAQSCYADAEPILREVLDTRRKVLIPDHPNIAQSLFNLGMLYEEMGRLDDAIPLLKEQFEAEDRLLANVFSVTSENERLAYAAKLRQQLDVLLMKLVLWGDRVDGIALGFEGVLRRKGIVAEAAAKDRLTTLAGADATARGLLEELNAARARLARAILDQSDTAGSETDLSRLEADRHRIEAKLARSVAVASLSSLAQANRSAVADAVPPGSALLEFVKFQTVARGASLGEARDAYAVFVVPDREPGNIAWSPLGPAETMEPAVQLLRACITQDADTFRRLKNVDIKSVDLAKTETGIGAQLIEVLIDRMRPHLGTRKRLFIAPDGILNQLPFEILPIAEGGQSRRRIRDLVPQFRP